LRPRRVRHLDAPDVLGVRDFLAQLFAELERHAVIERAPKG
jgi:hypothetical protein